MRNKILNKVTEQVANNRNQLHLWCI